MSTAYVADQDAAARVIRNNERSELVSISLQAGSYVLASSGTVEANDRRSVQCFIEFGPSVVASSGVTIEAGPVFMPMPTMFGVLDLQADGIVRVSALVSEFTPGEAAGVGFRLMAVSVDAIG